VTEQKTVDILIVDDRSAQRFTLAAALAGVAANAIEAASGPDALRLCLQRDFAVILLDLHMPEMDGFETASWIRRHPRSEHTPIIFVTADGDDAHVREGYRLGAVDYIQAPIDPDVLRSKVAAFVELYRLTDEARRCADSLREQSLQMKRLSELSLAVHGMSSPEDLLGAVVDAAREMIGADEAVAEVQLEAPGRPGPLRAVRHAVARPPDTGLCSLPPATFVGQANAAIRLGETELAAHPRWRALLGRSARGLRGWLAAPLLRRDGQLAGAIQLAGKRGGEFTAEDEALLVQLAQIASIASENTQIKEAQEANRQKDQFLATVSHELRTPLQAMLSWTSILRSQSLEPALLAKGLDVIERSANAQRQLIDDLLEVSRIVNNKLRLELATVSLRDVVRSAVEAARPVAAAKGVVLVADGGGADVHLVGDPHRLEQVLGNLLANAIKFTPAGGEVRAELARRGGVAQLRVVDTGDGIPAEFLPHIFEPFRQADSSSRRSHGGLGIGLAIVRHLVELHDGSVRAESDGAGKGARFIVELPIAAGPDPRARPERPATFGPRPIDGLRILLVEDVEDARTSLALLLERRGAVVTAVGSTEEALAALESCPQDVLLSDIAMPGRDGIELISAVRAGGRRIPAAALTAYARPEECTLALRAGFDLHLAKPIREDALLAGVVELLRKAEIPR
jgi:signal transduction histidine kinase/DNA-binding response OmpR family regulator